MIYRDPSKASAFIIPFDAGVHSYIDHKTGKPRLASPHGWYAIQLLKEASNKEVSTRFSCSVIVKSGRFLPMVCVTSLLMRYLVFNPP